MGHDAPDAPGPAQQRIRPFRIAVLQQPPDAGGGDRAREIGKRWGDREADAEGLSPSRQERHVAAPAMAEGEVGAANEVLRADPVMQQRAHEVIR
jgi:hypothetical protein